MTFAPLRIQAQPFDFEFDVAHTALIVIDMQNAYASPGGYLDLAGFDISGADRVIQNTGGVLEVARAAGMRIVGPNCLGIINPKLGMNAAPPNSKPVT